MDKVISKNMDALLKKMSVGLPYVDHIFRQTMRLINIYELNDEQMKSLLDKFKSINSIDDIREK